MTCDGDDVVLTPKEYDLLIELASDPGAIFTREHLMSQVWDRNWWGSTKTLDVHVASLRKKLRPEYIETVRGVGYRLRRCRHHPMTRRLVLSYLAITMIVLIILEIPLGIFYSQREEERLTADVERDAVVLASFYEDVLHFGFAPDPTPAEDYAARTGSRIVVVDTGGISVLDTEAAPARDFSTRPEVRTALTGVRSAGIRRSDTLDTDLLYVAVPVASGGTVHGVLRLTIDAHEVAERVQRFWMGLAGIAVVVLLAVAGIGFAIARSVTRPLRELQATARRFSEGDLTPGQLTADSPPEVRSLGDAMNAMATRLDELINAQRAFVSDASHQLRTPLTALRLRLENLETQLSTEADSAEVSAAIDEIQTTHRSRQRSPPPGPSRGVANHRHRGRRPDRLGSGRHLDRGRRRAGGDAAPGLSFRPAAGLGGVRRPRADPRQFVRQCAQRVADRLDHHRGDRPLRWHHDRPGGRPGTGPRRRVQGPGARSASGRGIAAPRGPDWDSPSPRP